ncbi:MAG TPA: RsmE family RNA methyltransferase [Kofleriaceae bacterium]
MNLLLLEPGEVRVTGRRAQHLREVIGAKVGSTVRAGVIGGEIGIARVTADDGEAIELALELGGAAPEGMHVELVLAMPRPKVLARVLEAVASFGVETVRLTNAWRVDKSYLKSPRLEREAIDEALRLGAEQGATTRLPQVTVHARLMELFDRAWPQPTKLIAHPGAPPLARVGGPCVLAIGPEGGWIEREVETFVARGFAPVSIGAPILRVETAIAAALGQILLLRRLERGADLAGEHRG